MRGSIPLELTGQPSIEVDGTLVAEGLGLDVDEFRRLMEVRKISVLCERGTGDDAGLFRASFYHGGRRMRLVVDVDGRPVDHPSISVQQGS